MLEKYLYKPKCGNICSDCQRNIMECPWLHEGRPYPGWDAEMVSRKEYPNNGKPWIWGVTWSVKSCPGHIKPEEGRCDDSE